MNLKTTKFTLPKGWKEASRMGSEDQVVIRVFHANPLSNIDPKELEDKSLESSDSNVFITKMAVPTSGVRPMNDFYRIMKGMIAGGMMPPEWTPGKLETLWGGMTKSANAERPGESDMANDIEIIQCKDEKIAWQTLKNKALMPTQGLDVPIPGNIMIPGLPENMSMSDLFQSDMLKNFIPKEQLENFSKMQSTIKEAQKQMPKIKQNLEKKGVKYREGKLFGCKAVFMDSPNLTPPPSSETRSSSKGNADGMGMGGPSPAGGDDSPPLLTPLPKFKKPYSSTISACMGISCNNFIIGGPLLLALESLPAGNTPCYSLTKTKEVREKIKDENGKEQTSITIVPLPSTYAEEGYLIKEDVEEIYQNIISKLK